MAHRMTLRPRKRKPVRLLELFWYQLPNDVLWNVGQVAAEPWHRYRLRSRTTG